MKAAKNDMAKLLMIVAQTMQEMSEDEFQQLLDRHGALKVVPMTTAVKAVKGKPLKTAASADLTMLAKKLSEVDTREEAREVIVKTGLLKNDLITLTSLLDVYVSKSDSKEKITEKIIESTAGARMRSKAIKDTRIGESVSGRKGG